LDFGGLAKKRGGERKDIFLFVEKPTPAGPCYGTRGAKILLKGKEIRRRGQFKEE